MKDEAGNESALTWKWTLDTKKPENLAITGTPANGAVTKEAAVSLAASATDDTTLTYRWTFNGAVSEGEALNATAKEGENVASVVAIDAAGNESAAVTWSWVQSDPPVVQQHDKVQLWEGGPYWATTNIGAEEPWDSGYYFWWGDTVGYKRENDAWVASDGSSSDFSFCPENTPTNDKFNEILQREGWITSEGVLASEHDAAHVHWGSNWRMPTRAEFEALNSNCDWTWGITNGVNGYIVSGRGDYATNSIFLPCAGYGSDFNIVMRNKYYLSWSSVPVPENCTLANAQYFHGTGLDGLRYYHRRYGLSVRPVQGSAK